MSAKRASIPVDITPKPIEWQRKQLGTIGGNAAACIMGKGYISKAQLWDRMHALLVEKRDPEPMPINDDMRRGLVLEPYARTLLAKHYDCKVDHHPQTKFVMSEEIPWGHALPDGTMPVARPIELKSPRPGTVAKALLHGLPERWRIQASHTMLFYPDITWMPVALLCPITMNLHVFTVEYDDRFAEELADAEHDFFQSIFKDERPGDEDVKALMPEDTLPAITGEEAVEAARSWNSLKALEMDIKEALEDARAELRMLSGENLAWEVPGILRVYDKPQAGRKSLNKDAVLKAFPVINDDEKFWKKSAGSRPFRSYNLEDK